MRNILSLFLGLTAWGLGFAAIAGKGRPALVFSSMTACAMSLLLQLWEVHSRAGLGDWAAVEDTIGAVLFAAAALVAVTVAVNLAALLRGGK